MTHDNLIIILNSLLEDVHEGRLKKGNKDFYEEVLMMIIALFENSVVGGTKN